MKEALEVQFDSSCPVSIKNEKIIGMYDDIFYILRVLLYYMMRTKKLPISSFHDLQVSLAKGQNY